MKKKHLIILVLAGMAALRVGAQTDDIDPAEQFVFGIKGGANYSNVWDEQGDDFRADAKLGGVIGLFVGIPVGPYFGVQVEGLLAQKGFQAGGSLLGSEYTMKKTKTSLDFPLQVALKPVEYVTILAGP
jgi:hypothetical protein